MITDIFKAAWAAKELIVTGIVIVTLAGLSWWLYSAVQERAQLKAELKLERAERALERAEWGKEVIKWNEQVLRQQQELDAVKKQKDAVIKKERQKFDAIFKQTNKIETTVTNEIQANLKLRSGVISVPRDFVRYYNSAVEGSRVAAEGGEVRNAEDSFRLVEEVVTYDAATFTEIVVGNALDCVSLAVRHNALVDVVDTLEKQNDDTSRVDGKTEDGGGNLPRRVIESVF